MAPRPGRQTRESARERRDRRAAIDDPQIVLDAAARFLEARPRSTAEVRRRLTEAGYRPELVQAAIDRMLELHVLDDRAFARLWIESRDRARPRSSRILAQELLDERSELGSATAEPAGDVEAQPTADEHAAERLLARRRATLLRIPDPRQRRQRAYALLARHGFDPEICRTLSQTVADAAAIDELGAIGQLGAAGDEGD